MPSAREFLEQLPQTPVGWPLPAANLEAEGAAIFKRNNNNKTVSVLACGQKQHLGQSCKGQLPVPQVLPRNKVSIPLALPEEPLPSADPSEAAVPVLSLQPLPTPSLVRSGACSQMQPAPSVYNKGTDKQAFHCNTVSLQGHDYIPCPTQGSLRGFQQPSTSPSRGCWNCLPRPASLSLSFVQVKGSPVSKSNLLPEGTKHFQKAQVLSA